MISELATRISGSSDLYRHQGRLPISGINFITCHDGFTLYDLFSYNQKHNEANGENNCDGCDYNLSCNYGVEGETDNLDILALRRQQVKNACAILLLSQGLPMLLAGDEFLNTQYGNNNAFCQDNETSWLDWSMVNKNSDIHRFFKHMIALRKRHPSLMRRQFLTGRTAHDKPIADISWHGCNLNQPSWVDPEAQCLAFTLAGIQPDEPDLHVIMNMSERDLTCELPVIQGKRWHLVVDTSLQSPNDIIASDQQPKVWTTPYNVGARTIVIFEN